MSAAASCVRRVGFACSAETALVEHEHLVMLLEQAAATLGVLAKISSRATEE